MSGNFLTIFVVWSFLGAAGGSWHVYALFQGLRELSFCEAMAFGAKSAEEIQRTCRRLFGYGPAFLMVLVLSGFVVWPYSLYHATRTLARLRPW